MINKIKKYFLRNIYRNPGTDDEQSYLQVDPRCYVRQNSNVSLAAHRKSDTPRLEKGHSLNVDTRPSPSSTSLSPYRQSSFDVTLAYRSQPQQTSSPSPSTSTQQEIYYTPRGSSLSVVTNPVSTPPTGSQHLSPPTPSASRKNSAAIIIEKKDLTATLDPFSKKKKNFKDFCLNLFIYFLRSNITCTFICCTTRT